jgi:DNA repair exonuclease SbcCD nuclease subunit
VNFIFRTDVHLADNAPISWKADYRAEILDCLSQIGLLAEIHNAKAVLDGGDFFHVKSAVRNSHALVIQAAEVHKKYPCPVYAVEGNHDLVYNNLDTIERQPLGVLFSTGVFHKLREHTFEEDGFFVRVVGVPYHPDRTVEDFKGIRKGSEDVLIVVAHALATLNPSSKVEEFFGEPVFKYEDLVFDGGPDVYNFGHWHKDQGVEKVGNTYFVNQGSISRGSLIQENVTRTPKIALIRTRPEVSVELLPLSVLEASEAFDMERKERLEAERDDIEKFVERLKVDATSDGVSIEGYIESLDFAKEVREVALGYLERARSEKT